MQDGLSGEFYQTLKNEYQLFTNPTKMQMREHFQFIIRPASP